MEQSLDLSDQEQKYLALVLENLPIEGKTVLEIGCGRGRLSRALLRYNPKLVIGIDYALTKKMQEFSDERLSLREADARNLDLPGNSIDSIFSINVFEHIDDLKKALAEMSRVLKPGGKIFTRFSPIWTSRVGHHYKHVKPEIVKHIPSWGHLFLAEQELKKAILKSSKNEELAEKASRTIFHRKGLNRLTYTDYLELFDFTSKEYSLQFDLKEIKDKRFQDFSHRLRKYPDHDRIKGLDVRGFVGTITKKTADQLA